MFGEKIVKNPQQKDKKCKKMVKKNFGTSKKLNQKMKNLEKNGKKMLKIK